MNRLYTTFLGLCMAAMSFAQTDNAFTFVNAAGETVADGSTVTVTDFEEGEFDGSVKMQSGLFVKSAVKLSAEESQCSMKINITKIDNGRIYHCFPSQCVDYTKVGEVQRDDHTPLLYGKDAKSILSEWFPADYGTCTVVYTLQRYGYDSATKQYTFIADGPSVTVNFVYSDPASIANIEAGDETTRHNLLGMPVKAEYKGIVIKGGKKVYNK